MTTGMKPRLWVYFQNTDEAGRARLDTVGSIQDLNEQGIVLAEGLQVFLYCFELEAEGVVAYSEDESRCETGADNRDGRSAVTSSASQSAGNCLGNGSMSPPSR